MITKAKVLTFDNMNTISKIPFIVLFAAVLLVTPSWAQLSPKNTQLVVNSAQVKRYLYVAVPGIRNYLEYGGHGILVYDVSDNYRLVKRIGTGGLKADGTPDFELFAFQLRSALDLPKLAVGTEVFLEEQVDQ